MADMHVRRFNNIMTRKKERGERLDLYSEMKMNFGEKRVSHEFFNSILDKMDKSIFTVDELNEMRNSFPKVHIGSTQIRKRYKEPSKEEVLVQTYLSVSKEPGKVSELKKFATDQGLNYNLFRQSVRKFAPDLELESLRAPRVINGEDEEKVLQLLKTGLPVISVSKLTEIPVKLVNRIADENGIVRIRRIRKPKPEPISEPILEPIPEVKEVIEIKEEIPEINDEVTQEMIPELTRTPIEGSPEPEEFTTYVAGKEAGLRLKSHFHDPLPTTIFENRDEFNKFAKRVANKYKVSTSSSRKFLLSQMKVWSWVGNGFKNTDHLINEYKSRITNLMANVEKRFPTEEEFSTLKTLKENMEFFIEIKKLIIND